MAENVFRGDAQNVAEVYTATFSAPAGANEPFWIQRNLKRITILSSSPTSAIDTAAAFLTAYNAGAGDIPELSEVGATGDSATAILTLTGNTPGNPFALTSSANIALVNTTDATGNDDIANVNNWSLGVLPIATNDVTFPPDNPKTALNGLAALAAIALGVVKIPCGTFGRPDWNENGYVEDRVKVFEFLSCTRLEIGTPTLSPDYCRVKVTQGAALIKNLGGQTSGLDANPKIILSSGGASTHIVENISGIIGLGYNADTFVCAKCTFGTLAVPGGAGSTDPAPTVYLGAGFSCTSRLAVYDGTVYTRTNFAIDQYGGLVIVISGNVTGVIVWNGGIFQWNSNGSLGTAGSGTGGGGAGAVEARGAGTIIDLSGSAVAYTLLADCVRATGGGAFLDPQKRFSPYQLYTDHDSSKLSVNGNEFLVTIN